MLLVERERQRHVRRAVGSAFVRRTTSFAHSDWRVFSFIRPRLRRAPHSTFIHAQPHSKLLTDLDTAGIEIASTQSISEETGVELQRLKVGVTSSTSRVATSKQLFTSRAAGEGRANNCWQLRRSVGRANLLPSA